MSALVRIRCGSRNVRHVVSRWQSRFAASGAVYQSDPSTLLVTGETSIEALEDLMRSLGGAETEVEIIWREGELLQA
jgi:hypothetical protein